ncbi:MAG: DUF5009 domain-containing protein [Flavobacteriaceae bacterium]
MLDSNFSSKRILSIDAFRAITMFLMIFVNDFWTLTNVPNWLEHQSANVDAIGFSDIIFPAFLFIVGLSIPFAILARRKKGEGKWIILQHVFIRTFALIIMGLYMVNFENINEELLMLNKYLWEIIMAIGIFLIWNYYKPFERIGKKRIYLLQILGIGLLIFLASIYKGGSPDNVEWMKTHWWGILGLIGWAYLINSLIYLFLGRRIFVLILAFLIFQILNVLEFATVSELPSIKLVVSASMHTSVCAGMLIGSLILHFRQLKKEKLFLVVLFSFGAICLIYGFALRPYWGGFSKIRATPSWTSVCIGISAITFLAMYILIDKFKFTKWVKPIKIAGTNTLTCYLLPYLIYPILALISFNLPSYLINGSVGLLKSFLFAFLVIGITGLLNKVNIKLKV